MPSSYTSLLGLVLPVTGDLSGTWGDTVNNGLTSLLDSAVAGTTTLTTDADVTLTTTTGAANQARQAIILWTASGTTTRTITAPAQSKIYTVINNSGSTQSIRLVGVGPTTGVTIVKGESAVCAWNGSDFVKISGTNGAATFSSITDTGLTSSRVTYAGTGGLLQDSANLTFNGTTLAAAAFYGPIGTTTGAAAGSFTTLTAASTVSGVGFTNFMASPPPIGSTAQNPGYFTGLRMYGSSSGYVGLQGAPAAGSTTYTLPTADGTNGQFLQTSGSGTLSWASATSTPAGSTTQVQYNNGGAFAGSANLTFNGTTLTATGFSGPIGSTGATTGAFTTLSASSTVSGTGFSTYLASPPAIGSSTANTGAFTTLSASSTVSGTGFSTYLASPPAIGSTAQNTGYFTGLRMYGSSSGYVGFQGAAAAGSTTYTLPAADGTAGYALVTNGSGTLSWATVGGTPGGSTTQVQFNNGGVFGGSANLTFDGTTLTAANFSDSSLTSGRVTYAGSGGNLVDSTNLTFDGTTLTAAGLAGPLTGTVGATTQNTGYFTGLRMYGSSSGYVGLQGAAAAGSTTYTLPAADGTSGQVLSTNGTGTLSWATASGGGTPGGSTTQVQYNSGGAFAGSANLTFDGTTLTAAGLAGPLTGTVGATTPNTGAFTTLSASSTVSGTGFSTYLASPPAIGGTAQNPGYFTTLRMYGSSSGYVGFQGAAAAGSTTYTLPAADGTSGQVLSTNGSGTLSWATASGGGGTPGGSNTQVQFNNSGSFGGVSGFTYDSSTSVLTAPNVVTSNGIFINSATVSSNITIATGNNGFSVGPMTVASGATVTVSSGQQWVVI